MSTLPGGPFYSRRGLPALERVTLTFPDGIPFPLVGMERLLSLIPSPPQSGERAG